MNYSITLSLLLLFGHVGYADMGTIEVNDVQRHIPLRLEQALQVRFTPYRRIYTSDDFTPLRFSESIASGRILPSRLAVAETGYIPERLEESTSYLPQRIVERSSYNSWIPRRIQDEMIARSYYMPVRFQQDLPEESLFERALNRMRARRMKETDESKETRQY